MSNADYPIDRLDKEILKLLKENSRYKNTEMAEKLGKSEGAIRKRISKLVDHGVIEKFTIEIAQRKDYGIWAVVMVQIGGTLGPSVIRDQVTELISRGLDTIYETAGDIDLMCVFHAESEMELQKHIETLRKIKGIEDTQTYIVLTRTKLPEEIY